MFHWSLAALAAPVATGPTELAIDVVGPLGELTATRRFRNDEPQPIDTELWFAIPPGGTIDGLTITVGPRTIHSAVVPREEAADRYVEAANQGQIATLLEQHEPDVAVERIANVLPGEDIVIELRLVVPVDRHDGLWELVVPLVIAPRLQDPGGEGPTYGPDDPGRVPYRDQVDATVRVQTGTALRWIESPSHPFRSQLGADEGHLWVDGARADRDLVIRWATAAPDTAISLLVGDGHGLLLIEPPAPYVRLEPPGADIVLLVDASDTMAGARWTRTLDAVAELLAGLRDADTFTVLVFADTVRGLAVREPAHADAIAGALLGLEHTPLGGTTNLALGLRFAFAVPTPPDRARTVVVVSDGGTDQDVLSLIPPGTTVHSVGIGGSTNQWLLRALASAGGGMAVTVRPEQDLKLGLRPVLDGLRGPVLTDMSVSFGSSDGEVVALPPMYADRLVTVSERGLDCTTPAIVRGSFVGRPFEELVRPTCTDQARPLRVLWARKAIAELEGHDPAAATRLAVEYGILTAHTSLLGIDSAVHDPSGAAVSAPVTMALPRELRSRTGETQEITVMARRLSIDTSSTGATVYLVDGENVGDAVTGTFSLNFNFDALEQIALRDAYRLPEFPGSSPPLAAETVGGTNNTEGRVHVHRLSGVGSAAPLGVEQVAGRVSGPVVRDEIWAVGSYVFDRSSALERDFVGHGGAVVLTAQPNPEHRFGASASGDTSQLALPTADVQRDTLAGRASWQWFLAPDVNTETAGAAYRLAFDGDEQLRLAGRWQATSLSVDDPAGGRHDLEAGVDLDRSDWSLVGGNADVWLGIVPPIDVDTTRVGLFVQDGYQPGDELFVDVGARADLTLGRAHLAPQLHLAWDPWGDGKTKLAAGVGRYYGHLGLPTAVLTPELGLSRLDEWQAVAERELLVDLALGVEADLRFRSELPVFGGGRADQRSWSARVYLRKIASRRWLASLSWRYTELLGPSATLIDDGSLDGFAHAADGEIAWDTPTDPWTLSVGLIGHWYADPLGTLVPDPSAASLPNAPRGTAGVRLAQVLDLKNGALTLDLEASWLQLLADDRDLSDWAWVSTPVLDQATASGPRLRVGLSYGFR